MNVKRHEEEAALTSLLGHLRATGKANWTKESEPDAGDSSRSLPDFIACESGTGRRAAIEITSFDWPTHERTFMESMLSVAAKVPEKCQSGARGVFSVTVDYLPTWGKGVFATAAREKTKQTLADAIDNVGTTMHSGESRVLRGPFEFTLSRGPHSDPLCLTVGYHVARDAAEELRDLEEVLRDNARKFKDFSHLWRVMVVAYGGIQDDLWLIGPMLRVPRQVDDLFFIVREESRTRVVSYRSVSAPPFPVPEGA